MTTTESSPRRFTWAEVPNEEKKRLAERERAQRAETAKRGLPARSISVEGLWLVQSGCCTCAVCDGAVPLNPFAETGAPDRIVIAHVFFRAGKGSPGHVATNVALWRNECNKRETPSETSAAARGARFEIRKDVVATRDDEPVIENNGVFAHLKRSRKMQSRPFEKPPKGRSQWGKKKRDHSNNRKGD